MADLTSNDVQRAVQEGVRALSGEVLKQMQKITSFAQDIQMIKQNLQQTSGTTSNAMAFSPPDLTEVNQLMTSIQAELAALKSRTAGVEANQ